MSTEYPRTRTTITYALQSEQPYGEWEPSTGYHSDLEEMWEWLETRRQTRTTQLHRLIKRTITETIEIMEEP